MIIGSDETLGSDLMGFLSVCLVSDGSILVCFNFLFGVKVVGLGAERFFELLLVGWDVVASLGVAFEADRVVTILNVGLQVRNLLNVKTCRIVLLFRIMFSYHDVTKQLTDSSTTPHGYFACNRAVVVFTIHTTLEVVT